MPPTTIAWCDHSINPIRARNLETGAVGHYCEKISPGCRHCYSSTLQVRFQMPSFQEQRGSGSSIEPFLDTTKLEQVLQRKKPTKYFWADMTDLFGDWVSDAWLDECFATMALTPQHTHMVLTKRPERMLAFLQTFKRKMGGPRSWLPHLLRHVPQERQDDVFLWPLPNVWCGVSVENQAAAEARIPLLLQVPAAIRFLSCEPILSSIDLLKYLQEGDIYDRRRESLSSTNSIGMVHSSRRWNDMEACKIHGRGDIGSRENTSHSGREKSLEKEWLSQNTVSRQWTQAESGSSSDCLDDLQQRLYSISTPDQSLKWDKERQSSFEFRESNSENEYPTCFSESSSEEKSTIRRKECGSKSKQRASSADQKSLGKQSNVTEKDRRNIRNNTISGIGNSTGKILGGISWVICGGESGTQARPCQISWIRNLVQQCDQAQVAVFVKQLGRRAYDCHQIYVVGEGRVHECEGCEQCRYHTKDTKGADPTEWPLALRIQEFPLTSTLH